ncbi:MAG: seryl-tRNA synthetase [Chlorobi bacterium OLB6]|nr:MAG: seryl-tRNA synthetase [Chlorobi bacterium OLB6]
MRVIGDRIKDLDDVLRSVDAELEQAMLLIPNMAHESVPTGKSADDNVEVRRHGSCSERSFRLDHIQLGANKGIIDFDKGAKVTGSGFGYLTGLGAKLERALINYSLDKASAAGYTEIVPPFVANPQSFIGTAQLPKSADDMYFIEKDNLYLIPTAEVTITNFHRDDVLAGSTLPRTYCGYSACFRREAGSYGKDTRGFLRVHQFNKVELVQFAHPDESYSILEEMVHHVENMLVELGLTYRVLLLCSGDMTFGGAKTYDLEVWAPAEQRWLEVSSCTNFERFRLEGQISALKLTQTQNRSLFIPLMDPVLQFPEFWCRCLNSTSKKMDR